MQQLRIPAQLIGLMARNHLADAIRRDLQQPPFDHLPLVRLHIPDSNAQWLLSEYDHATRSAYGLVQRAGEPDFFVYDHVDVDAFPEGVRYDLDFATSQPLSHFFHHHA